MEVVEEEHSVQRNRSRGRLTALYSALYILITREEQLAADFIQLEEVKKVPKKQRLSSSSKANASSSSEDSAVTASTCSKPYLSASCLKTDAKRATDMKLSEGTYRKVSSLSTASQTMR